MKIKFFIFFFFITYYSVSQTNKDTIVFSHRSGFYKDSIYLKLSNLNSDKIFFSDNGDYPKIEYKKPILLTKSTTIRVKNGKTLQGYTRNYLFTGRKIELPVICITIKPSDLYDTTSGIYVKGKSAKKDPPYEGANFHKNWERPCYIELIDTNNKVGFNQKVGIKIFGQFSAMLPQKSFSFHARKKYGKGKIKHPLFPDLPFTKYNNFVLRNSGSDYCNSHIRDVMMTSLVKEFNIETQDYRSCVVYLNGEYWGIYHMREKINEHYLKQHFKVDKDSVAIMKHRMDVQEYGRMNYKKIISFIKKEDLSENKNIAILSKWIDIDNYLDYNIAQVYFSNIDAGGNIRYWRERKEGSKWRWILYDTDFGFGLRKGNGASENTVKRFTEYSSEKWPFPSWSTLIIRKLLENDSIKELYLQKFNHYLNTTFQSQHVLNHIELIKNNLNKEMPYHFKKWKRRKTFWDKNISNLESFATERPGYLFEHLKEKFEIDSFYNVTINYNQTEAQVSFDSYKVDSGFSGKYFSNLTYDINLTPKFGYEFSHWNNTYDSLKREITVTKDTILNPIFVRKGNSKFKGGIILNEIGLTDTSNFCYIELYNSTEEDISLSNWIFINGSNSYKINENIIIKANSFFSFLTKNKNNIENTEEGLFNIYENDLIELFSSEEEFVENIKLNTKNFKNGNKYERVNTSIKNKWEESQEESLNKENIMQIESIRENKIIIILFLSLIGFIILTALFSFFKNKKRKQ